MSAETERERGIESIELCERDKDGGESSSDAENSSREPSPGITDGRADQDIDTEMGADDTAGLREGACSELEQEQVANSDDEREDEGVTYTEGGRRRWDTAMQEAVKTLRKRRRT